MVRASRAPAPIHGTELWRWDLVEVDSGRTACSIVFDPKLEPTFGAVDRRVHALERLINEAGAT